MSEDTDLTVIDMDISESESDVVDVDYEEETIESESDVVEVDYEEETIEAIKRFIETYKEPESQMVEKRKKGANCMIFKRLAGVAEAQAMQDMVDMDDYRMRGTIEKIVMDDNVTALEMMRSKGARVTYRDPDGGWTYLHRAASVGSMCTIIYLVNGMGMDVNDAMHTWQLTPLHMAVRHEQAETMKLLIQLGADIDATDSSDNTALHFAARTGRWVIVMFLVLVGCSLRHTNYSGQTAKQVAKAYRKYGNYFSLKQAERHVLRCLDCLRVQDERDTPRVPFKGFFPLKRINTHSSFMDTDCSKRLKMS